MEHDFWHNKWDINQIGFHLNYIHPLLKRNLKLFQLDEALKEQNEQKREEREQDSHRPKIFVPLCGKTLDIGYLLAQGYSVVAIELSEIAVQEVFASLELQPNNQPIISEWVGGKLYQTKNLQVFVGDFFALTQEDLGEIALVYDRAALVALPESMRKDYSSQLEKITQQAPQLLITLDYDQTVAGGPPFAVSSDEVECLYAANYPIQLLEEDDIIEQEPRFKAKGLTSFYQRAYRLK
ncbi:Putative thiopurine S-methyltransferase family protein [Oleispira antarctica RB-8]|uniref:Thiopurine S-methyltransferase n=1 Tax=Oleispira antarctica RB-8 TaxID=698738 RepID=R4YUP4_OLEAN|nr:Putative thiopurine S-methyltransferase family protein [Oleispira antarctica RB-8]